MKLKKKKNTYIKLTEKMLFYTSLYVRTRTSKNECGL